MSTPPTLEDRLRAHFDAEADEPGLDRLLRAVETGRIDDLDPDDRSTLDAFHATADAWAEAPPRRQTRRRWAVVGLLTAAAAAVVVFAWRPATHPGLTAMGGAFDLHVTVVQDGALRPIDSAQLRDGDRLGLAYSGPPGHLRVLAASADGVASLHPMGDGSTAVDGGERQPLPAGAVLTPGGGCEWIVGLYAADPIPGERAVAALQAAVDARTERCRLGPVDLPDVAVRIVEIPR